MRDKIIDRYVYPSNADISLDSNGLLAPISKDCLKYTSLINLQEFAKLPGAILLAEGGMGKTIFMQRLKDQFPDGQTHLVELGRYSADLAGLREDIRPFIQTAANSSTFAFIFDGLDEAVDLSGAVLRLIHEIPKTSTIWIASRDVTAIRSIQSELSDLKTYSLAPLSKQDIRELAVDNGIDGDNFLKAVYRQGIAGICAKPLGCEFAISVFRDNGLAGVSQRDLWHKGIRRLCDETPSVTKRLALPSPDTLDQIVECSAWIALCLVLSESTDIWVDEQSYYPQQCTNVSSLASNKFPSELIRTTLERGVFNPLGDGRIRFAHSVYRDYLAAYGLTVLIPPTHWEQLLLNADRSGVFLQRTGIAAWLASFNQGFLEELSGIQPELLLASTDTVQAVGPAELCTAMLDRADSISYQQRHSDAIAGNLFRLAAPDTSAVIRDCLLNKNSSESAIEFATEIAEACEFSELSNVFADRVLDQTLTLHQRVDASYALFRLKDVAAQGRLKSLLPIDPASDPQDNLRGNVLRCLWPDHISPTELVRHLTPPQKANYTGSYGSFLDYELPGSLMSTIDENNALALLVWALDYISEYDPFDRLSRLARTIFTFCWQWTSIPAIASTLAQGYLKALEKHRSPFLEKEYGNTSNLLLSREDFLRDVDGRLAILEAILVESNISERTLSHICVNDYPLYTPEDFEILIDRALANPDGPLAEKWISCIKAVIWRVDLEKYADKIDKLHALCPDLIDSSQKIREDADVAAKRAEEWDQKWQKKDASHRAEAEANQLRIDQDIKSALQQTNLAPESFGGIAAWLNSDNGRRRLGPIDLRQSIGWGKLTSEEQNALITLAERYLKEGTIEPTAPNQHIYSVAQALTLLRVMKPGIYQWLTEDIWRKCSVELLKAVFNDHVEYLNPLFDTLATSFQEVAETALLNVIHQELNSGHISIPHHWANRLSDKQAQSILQIVKEPGITPEKSFLILSELVRHGQENLVHAYLDTLFNGTWESPPDQYLNKHLALAFSLSPNSYVYQLLETIQANREWGRQWIEKVVMDWENGFTKGLFSCDPDVIADTYIWLNIEYPTNTCPEHEEPYSPKPLDEIHKLKFYIINHLTKNGIDGSTVALKQILHQFPEDTWLNNYIIEAQAAEQAKNITPLSIEDIKKLYDKKRASCRLINSAQDLSLLILEKLKEYQMYLQGDIPAIGDLWNSNVPIRPKDEEYLSDHLIRFLKLTLSSEIIINREVQIRRKLYKEGKSGSRTDIWIQATDKNDQVLTLCIEVKCNWNPSAKTAIKDQLINKYMAGKTAEAGILLLGWYACSKWDGSDGRKARSSNAWRNIYAAQDDLKKQADQECKNEILVTAKVVNCNLE